MGGRERGRKGWYYETNGSNRTNGREEGGGRREENN
jgi:hypothetical protein